MTEEKDFVADPSQWASFEIRVRKLELAADWKSLERLTRSMLLAVSRSKDDLVAGRPRNDVEIELWRNLRTVYADRLGDVGSAIEAAAMGARLAPNELADQLALAELWAKKRDPERAAEVYEIALALAPTRAATFRSLAFLRRNDVDAAHAIAGVLGFQGDARERAVWEAQRLRLLPRATGTLERADWFAQIHPRDQVPDLDALFGTLAHAFFAMKVNGDAVNEPERNPRFVPGALRQAPRRFRAAFAWAIARFGFPEQEHFADPGAEPTADGHGKTDTLTLTPGTPLDTREEDGFTLRELLFVAGRQVALHRPWHLLMYPNSMKDLTVLFWIAITLVRPDVKPPPELQKSVEVLALAQKQAMAPAMKTELERDVRRFLSGSAKANVKQWARVQWLTSARAGLLLAGDLEVARRMLAAEPTGTEGSDAVTVEETMTDLAVFAASREYAALRKRLGFTVTIPKERPPVHPSQVLSIAYLAFADEVYSARREIAELVPSSLAEAALTANKELEAELPRIAALSERRKIVGEIAGVAIDPKTGVATGMAPYMSDRGTATVFLLGDAGKRLQLAIWMLAELARFRALAPSDARDLAKLDEAIESRLQAANGALDQMDAAVRSSDRPWLMRLPDVRELLLDGMKLDAVARGEKVGELTAAEALFVLARKLEDRILQSFGHAVSVPPPIAAKAPPTPREAECLRDILENPQADEPRLLFAELAAERDPDRAEMIREQFLARAKHVAEGPSEEIGHLERAKELASLHPEWTKSLVDLGARDVVFDRGFPAAIAIGPQLFLECGREIVTLAPITKVDFGGAKLTDEEIADLARLEAKIGRPLAGLRRA